MAGTGTDARQARQIAIRSITSGVTIVGGTIVIGGSPVGAASFVVTNTNASGPGSFAQAVLDANAAADLDTITFANGVQGTITSPSTTRIKNDLVIVGQGQGVITLTSATGNVLYLYNGADLEISQLTISGGNNNGLRGYQVGDVTVSDITIAAIPNSGMSVYGAGDVSVARTTVTNTGSDGVRVGSANDVTITDVDVTNVADDGFDFFRINAAAVSGSSVSGAAGGGIEADYMTGAFTVTDSVFNDNGRGLDLYRATAVEVTNVETTGNADGGVYMYKTADVEITDSNFSRNGDDGVHLQRVGHVTISGSTSNDNFGEGFRARYLDDFTVTDTVASGNSDLGIGASYGGIAEISGVIASDNTDEGVRITEFGDVTIEDSITNINKDQGIRVNRSDKVTISDVTSSNNSDTNIYLTYVADVIIEDTVVADGFDRGVFLRTATSATLQRVNIVGNARAGVQVYSGGPVSVEESTISSGKDSGISLRSTADLDVINSTIVGNVNDGISVEFGNVTIDVDHSTITDNGGDALDVNVDNAVVAVRNSIVSGNGGNVSNISAGTSTLFVARSLVPETYVALNGNVPVADAMLEPLGDFGGPTFTRPPMLGSPAINAGDPLFVAPPATDQRGLPRVVGGRLDVGAVEFDAGSAGMAAAAVSVAEDAGVVPIVVNRSGTGDGAASVLVTTSGGTATSGDDFTGVSQTVSWAAGEVGAKTVSVPILTDELLEGDETFTVTLSSPVGVGLTAATTTVVTITNVVPEPDVPAIVPVAPARFLDTRPGELTFDTQSQGVGRPSGGAVLTVKVAGRGEVPSDAVGVVANLTAIAPGAPGFATMFPCGGTVPTASHVNYFAGEVVANNVVVPLNAAGEVCIFTLADADYAMDVNGYVPAGSPVGLFEPSRFLDTRAGEVTFDGQSQGEGQATAGEIVEVQVAGRGVVPSTAAAVMVNLTSIFPDGPGFATLFPCGGTPPAASTLNYFAGSVVPNGAITKLSADGKVCIYTLTGADFALDVAGFVPAGVDSLETLSPVRVMETRAGETTVDGQSQGIGRIGAGEFREVQIAGRAGVPVDATAALLNVATIFPDGPGFVTLYPCGDVPTTSNLNHATGGTVRANNAITKLSDDGTVCVFTLSGADLIIDLAGYLE